MGVLADLKRDEQEQADIQRIMLDNAHKAMGEPAKVAGLLAEYELDFSAEIARIMRELDRACRGDSISTTACLTACSHMQAKLLDASKHSEGIE